MIAVANFIGSKEGCRIVLFCINNVDTLTSLRTKSVQKNPKHFKTSRDLLSLLKVKRFYGCRVLEFQFQTGAERRRRELN